MLKRKYAAMMMVATMMAGAIQANANEVDTSDPVTISVWLMTDDLQYYSDYASNPVLNYVAKQNNITFEFQQPPTGSEQEQFNLMIGIGEYTDVFWTSYSQDSMSSLYEDGVVQDIAPYVEEFMPNLSAYLNGDGEDNKEAKATLYDDDGRMYVLPIINTFTDNWGGLVYRRDILETMTGGNVEFPSGNDRPTTVEDWDYMLPLMKAYFEAAGMTDYACLIIPATGYFTTGDLLGGFGISGGIFVKEDGSLSFGLADDAFYNYLSKMKEWYEAGYIYQDFASRTNDVFYLPNTALTYGGSAGVWFGLSGQVGTAMSMPEYGLNVQVGAINAPLDEEHGVTADDAGIHVYSGVANNTTGYAISTSCDEEKLIRYLSAMDYFYSEEGSQLRAYGLDKEHGSEEDPIYETLGLQDGTWFVNDQGEKEYNAVISDNADIKTDGLIGVRLPGLTCTAITRNCMLQDGEDVTKEASEIWSAYGEDNVLPSGVTLTADESSRTSSIYTQMIDYINSMVPKFIMGTEELTEESFKEYQEQLESYGLSEYMELNQAAYDRYQSRRQ